MANRSMTSVENKRPSSCQSDSNSGWSMGKPVGVLNALKGCQVGADGMRGYISSFEPWAPDGASPSGAASLPLECPNGSQTGLPRLKPKACS